MPDASFEFDRARVFTLYEERRFEEALTVADEAAGRHPDRPAETTFWRACFLSLIGRTDDAVDAFRGALDRGVWWTRTWLESDPDLDPLRSLPAFDDILAGSDANLAAARSGFADRPEVRLHVPDGPPRALLLVMHMLGATAAETEPHWRGGAELGAVIVVVGSSQRTSDGQPCWELDDLVVRDLALARDEALGAGIGGDVPVVLAGASQGGRRAIELGIDGRVPSLGFLAVATGVPALERLTPYVPFAIERGIRGWILIGEHDRQAAEAERLGGDLAGAGLDVRVVSVAGLGHDYPGDFPSRLGEGLELVLRRAGD
jgi:hypothetical protein